MPDEREGRCDEVMIGDIPVLLELEPCVAGAGHMHIDQRVEQSNPLPPELQQVAIVGLLPEQLGGFELAIDPRDTILQLSRDPGGPAVQHPTGRVVLAERAFEQLGPLHRLAELFRELDRRVGTRSPTAMASATEAARARPLRPATRVRRRRRSAREPGLGLGPAVAAGPERGQRLQPGHPLVQPLQLGLAMRALVQVLARRRLARLSARLPQADQRIHRQMSHGIISSPSQMRSRAWARDSCDFEKLGVLPIMLAISSWV